jgi:hypothetical protein
MFRTVAITGRTDTVNAWFADRQSGRWAEQKVRDAFPRVGPHPDRANTLRDLTELRQRGVLNEAEFERLRARMRV